MGECEACGDTIAAGTLCADCKAMHTLEPDLLPVDDTDPDLVRVEPERDRALLEQEIAMLHDQLAEQKRLRALAEDQRAELAGAYQQLDRRVHGLQAIPTNRYAPPQHYAQLFPDRPAMSMVLVRAPWWRRLLRFLGVTT